MGDANINGIVQIGILVRDADEAVRQYEKLLGVSNWNINLVDTENGRGRNFRTGEKDVAVKAKIAWTTIGGIELELIEPQDTTSIYAQHLETHGPGVHHLMFGARDYEGAVNSLTDCGVERILSGELQRTRFQLFDTRKTLGLISEFAEGEALVPDD
jgi:catechol 2,3-dioxygenase-like lactoylglutathione lyase family enzyme